MRIYLGLFDIFDYSSALLVNIFLLRLYFGINYLKFLRL